MMAGRLSKYYDETIPSFILLFAKLINFSSFKKKKMLRQKKVIICGYHIDSEQAMSITMLSFSIGFAFLFVSLLISFDYNWNNASCLIKNKSVKNEPQLCSKGICIFSYYSGTAIIQERGVELPFQTMIECDNREPECYGKIVVGDKIDCWFDSKHRLWSLEYLTPIHKILFVIAVFFLTSMFSCYQLHKRLDNN